jgi:hypothetical protein
MAGSGSHSMSIVPPPAGSCCQPRYVVRPSSVPLTGIEPPPPADTQFLEFEVAQSSTVYVAHDTRIRLKPRWLANNFMDTGMQLRVGSVAFELYSNVYPRHAIVTLGSNIPGGGGDRGRMYSVFVVPTADNAEIPQAPAPVQVVCATAAVVGLEWQEPDAAKVAGYRISRDGAVIGTTFNSYFADTSVAAATAYTYVVTPFDTAGNTAASAAVRRSPPRLPPLAMRPTVQAPSSRA